MLLPGGSRTVIAGGHRRVTDEEPYQPGWPGSYYAFHHDGAHWLEPINLGDSDGINGSEKHPSFMTDPGTGVVHLP